MAVTRYFSFAEETTFGVPVLSGGETIDPESAPVDPNGESMIVYEGVSGLDRIVVPGNYTSGGSVTAPFDLKAAPWFLKWLLGGYQVSGGGPTYTHTFFPQQDSLLKSFTARVGKDKFEHVFSGCVVSSMSLTGDANIINATVNILGGKDQKEDLNPSPTFTYGNVYAPCNVTMEVDNVDRSIYIERFTLNIENGADNASGITFGSRFPRRAYRGALLVTMELGVSFFDTSELERFWGDPAGAVGCQTPGTYNTIIHLGTDIDIILPRCVYTAVTTPLEGRERIQQTVSLRALASMDGLTSPITFAITNDVEEYA